MFVVQLSGMKKKDWNMSSEAKYYFQISPSSGVPIYRQVVDQVKTLIATGRLAEGVFLPSVRQVSKELEINPMTVSKAYSLLEKEGVVMVVRGQGMKVIKSKVPAKSLGKREDQLTPILKEVVIKAKQLALSPKKVIELFQNIWEEQKDE